MPTPELDLFVAPDTTAFSVGLEPAHNLLNSLMLITKAEKLSGLDPWITRTAAALTAEQRHKNHLVLHGFYYALIPERRYPDFLSFVDDLASTEPAELRDRVLHAYFHMPPRAADADPVEDYTSILADKETYLHFLLDRFPVETIDAALESEAFSYMVDPPAMQALIVSHLREMWETILAPEWRRVTPMLQSAVDAFRRVDFSGMTNLEAARTVTGQDLEDCWDNSLERAERIIFVPSAHVGPYLGRFKANGTIWLVFGARLPEGTSVVSPDLSRAEILVRLSALADDNRLRILKLVAEDGELSSKDIMTRLELSQSAASRHLTQLSATGYLSERRCEGAKCYALNSERVQDTLGAISAYLELG